MKADTTHAAVCSSAACNSAVCGIWIEFLDESGNTLARHIVDEWHGRPVPARGDRFHVADIIGVRNHQGIVVDRRYELQHTAEGEPRLWVQLVVRVLTGVRPSSLAMSYSNALLTSPN
ncbi:MAG: hypothetical protein K8U03_11965 [Planctomycetia bacterium]|nr:hypothetical protein [Planctomycetia bacterium]